MINVGIVGSTGYGGCELVRFLLTHPNVHIEWVSSRTYSDQEYSDVYKGYFTLLDQKCVDEDIEKYLDNVEEVKFAGVTNYKGQVINGNKEGFGISVNHGGYFYIGEWSKGEKSGIGKLVTDDMKMVLEGEFLSDLAHGTVDISWEDGSEWHGEYRQGFPWNGSGKAILPWNGNSKIMLCTKIQEGVWKNGLKVQ